MKSSPTMVIVIAALAAAVAVLGYVVYDMQREDENAIKIELPSVGN